MHDAGVVASGLGAFVDGLTIAVAGVAIFLAPGAIVCRAAGLELRWVEKPSAWFAGSLALLTATFAVCLGAGAGLNAGLPMLATMTALGGFALARLFPRPIDDAPRNRGSRLSDGATPVFTALLLFALFVAAVVIATTLAPVGSVDRWWYLAYIRGWMQAPTLSQEEPFLGTGRAFARFGVHPWLFGIALWARLAAADPLRIWETGAPALVVIASISAAATFSRTLFGDGARARLAVIATILLWSGALLPLLARAAEDKVMAAAALFPLCCAALLRFLSGGHARRRELLLLVAAAVATAAVHALDYAFVLLALLPTAAVVAWRRVDLRPRAAVACLALLIIAAAPAASGLLVRERLGEIGAELSAADHPVVRVHEGRDRLVEPPLVGTVVNPRLLLHPLVVLALGGALFGLVATARKTWFGFDAAKHEARQGVDRAPMAALPGVDRAPVAAPGIDAAPVAAPGIDAAPVAALPGIDAAPVAALPDVAAASRAALSDPTRVFLAVTTLLALALAFVPPLPSIVGAVIPPWMVYRVLWIMPLAPLAAESALRVCRRFGGGEVAAALLLAILGSLPMLAAARVDDVRERVAVPTDAAFGGLIDAIAALPADSLVVAAPELAERLPALAGKHVVAGLDRSTVVFAGSRERGEARLRARAALLSGSEDAWSLAEASGISVTHAVFDPRSSMRPVCDRMLFQTAAFALCELRASGSAAAGIALLEDATASTMVHVVTARCRPDVTLTQSTSTSGPSRRDPWSASAPTVRCLLPIPRDVQDRDDLVLIVEVTTGRAADELRISIHDGASSLAWTGRDAASPLASAARDAAESPALAARRVRVSDGVAVALRLPRLSSPTVEIRLASSFLAFVRPREVKIAIAPRR